MALPAISGGADAAACDSGGFLALLGADLVKLGELMVWSFAAGFIERLLPDALDSLAMAAESTTPSVDRPMCDVTRCQASPMIFST